MRVELRLFQGISNKTFHTTEPVPIFGMDMDQRRLDGTWIRKLLETEHKYIFWYISAHTASRVRDGVFRLWRAMDTPTSNCGLNSR
jgi:hypothetical protein